VNAIDKAFNEQRASIARKLDESVAHVGTGGVKLVAGWGQIDLTQRRELDLMVFDEVLAPMWRALVGRHLSNQGIAPVSFPLLRKRGGESVVQVLKHVSDLITLDA
jgi:hypothetical protein